MRKLRNMATVLLALLVPSLCWAIDGFQIQGAGTGDFTLNSLRSDTATVEGVTTQVLDREEVRGVGGQFTYQTDVGTGRQSALEFVGDQMVSDGKMAQAFGWSQRSDTAGIAEAFIGEGQGRNLLLNGTGSAAPGAISGLIEMQSDGLGRVGVASLECTDGSCSEELTEALYRGTGQIGLNIPAGTPSAGIDEPWWEGLGDICRHANGSLNLNPWQEPADEVLPEPEPEGE